MPWLLLGIAMACSAVFSLWASRGVFFSSDELFWVGTSPGLDPGGVFDSYSSHLVAVPRLLYKAILETLGGGYLPFRLAGLGAVFLSVGLLFEWARHRVGDFLALAPCVVLVFFGSDSLHLLLGNGFTVMFPVACGLAALLALERRTRGGDLLACLALCVGVLTYTTGLPFVFGTAVAVLCRSDRWRRIWIPLAPLAIYAGWRLWLSAAGVEHSSDVIDIWNVLLLPAWVFQSLSAILDAMTGLAYNFSGPDPAVPDGIAGPALALIFVAGVAWRIGKAGFTTGLAVVFAVALSLFLMQTLTWLPPPRVPGADRYLFPGAVVAILVATEAARSLPVSRKALLSVWLVALAGLGTNLVLIHDQGKALGAAGEQNRARVTAFELSRQALPSGTDSSQESTFEPWISGLGEAAERYGVGQAPEELKEAPPEARTAADSSLAEELGVEIVPSAGATGAAGCRELRSDGETVEEVLPPGGSRLKSETGGTVGLRRFGDDFSVDLGSLPPGTWVRLAVPQDDARQPWQISVGASEITSCPIR